MQQPTCTGDAPMDCMCSGRVDKAIPSLTISARTVNRIGVTVAGSRSSSSLPSSPLSCMGGTLDEDDATCSGKGLLLVCCCSDLLLHQAKLEDEVLVSRRPCRKGRPFSGMKPSDSVGKKSSTNKGAWCNQWDGAFILWSLLFGRCKYL